MKRLTRKQKAQKAQIKQVIIFAPVLVSALVFAHLLGGAL